MYSQVLLGFVTWKESSRLPLEPHPSRQSRVVGLLKQNSDLTILGVVLFCLECPVSGFSFCTET